MSDYDNKTALTLPSMALRGLTVFPSMLLHFDVGRQSSIQAMEQAVELGSYMFLVPQRDLSVDEPEMDDLYEIGTIAAIRQVLRLPGDNIRVMMEGISRARLVECWQEKPYLILQVDQIEEQETERHTPRVEAVIRTTCELMEQYCDLSTKVSSDIMLTVLSSKKPGYLADYIAQNISIRGEDKQIILEELRPDLALISVGYNNYGHPHAEVLRRLENYHIPVLRTDEEGSITVKAGG